MRLSAASNRGWMLVLGMLCAACSGGTPTSPGAVSATALTERLDTEHAVFHFSAGDTVDATRQEAHVTWLMRHLTVDLPGKLQYFKYRDRAHMGALLGQAANGLAVPERLEVHSVFAWHPHEAVHVYSAQIGRPSDFFNEGLAVALATDPQAGRFDGSYSGEPVHAWARRSRGALLTIESIVTTEGFRRVDEFVGYQQAGSFVEFLIESEGVSPMRELFQRGAREDTMDTIRSAFARSFGFTLVEAERRWLLFLDGAGGGH